MCDFTWSTTSTELSEQNSDMTLEKLMKVVNEFKKKSPNPFEKLAAEHGYSLKDGDIMVVPEGTSRLFPLGILPSGLKESKLIAHDKMYLMRNPFPKPV